VYIESYPQGMYLLSNMIDW